MIKEIESKLILEKQSKLLASTSGDQVDRLFSRIVELLRFGGFSIQPKPLVANLDTYFDTPDKQLHQAGVLMRVRIGSASHLLTIKKKDQGQNQALERDETEIEIDDATYRKMREQGFVSELRTHFPNIAGPASEVARITTDRRQAEAVLNGHALKICLDVSKVGNESIGVELEIEAQDAAASVAMQHVAEAIIKVFPEFSPNKRSKLTRALDANKTFVTSSAPPTHFWQKGIFWTVAGPIIVAVIGMVATLMAG